MTSELVMVVVVEAFDGRVLDGAVHPFDLAAIRENDPPNRFLIFMAPGVVWFGCPVFDAKRRAGIFESVRPDGFAICQGFGDQLCCRSTRAGRGEMGAAAMGLEVAIVAPLVRATMATAHQ